MSSTTYPKQGTVITSDFSLATFFRFTSKAKEQEVIPPNLVDNLSDFEGDILRRFSAQQGKWANSLLNRSQETDYERYYLSATRTDVKHKEFVQIIKRHLMVDLSDWINNLSHQLAEYQNICPALQEWNTQHYAFLAYLQGFLERYPSTLDSASFSTAAAVQLLQEFVQKAKGFTAEIVFLDNMHEYQTGIVMGLTALKYFAIAVASIMPDFASKVAKALKLPLALLWESKIKFIMHNTKIDNLRGSVLNTWIY